MANISLVIVNTLLICSLLCVFHRPYLFSPDIGYMARVRDKENGDFSGLPNKWLTIFIVTFNLNMSLEHKALKKEFTHFKAFIEKQPWCTVGTQVRPELCLSRWSPARSFPSWSFASLAHWQLFTCVAGQPLVVCDFFDGWSFTCPSAWLDTDLTQPGLETAGKWSQVREQAEHQEKQEPAWDCLVVLSCLKHCFLWAATQMGSALHQKCRDKLMQTGHYEIHLKNTYAVTFQHLPVVQGSLACLPSWLSTSLCS